MLKVLTSVKDSKGTGEMLHRAAMMAGRRIAGKKERM
jgi:hypothetical protein